MEGEFRKEGLLDMEQVPAYSLESTDNDVFLTVYSEPEAYSALPLIEQ